MLKEDLIKADEFCTHHHIEYSFISTLNEFGLIRISAVKETKFIPLSQLPELEKFIRLHYDLDINLEGIQAIAHLLQRVNNMQEEITVLKNRLRMFDETDE